MRSLSSPSTSTSPSLADAASPHTVHETTATMSPASFVLASPLVSAAAVTSPHASSPASPSSAVPATPSPLPVCTLSDSVTSLTPSKKSLQEENLELRIENNRLREELKVILDHSIESDTGLLQFTENVFVPRVTSETSTCLFPTDTNPSPRPHSPASAAPNLTTAHTSAHPVDYLELINSLKTTIEVLEAEIAMYRNVQLGRLSEVTAETFLSTTVYNKTSDPLPTKNKFEVLKYSRGNSHVNKSPEKFVSHQDFQTKIKKAKKPNNNKSNSTKKVILPFENLVIYSDSHGRHLGSHLAHGTDNRTLVTNHCYPSARLKSVIPTRPPPPGSCSLILAGTNDVAEGLVSNIYRHLEGYVTSLLRTSKVLVATLPCRHDLASSHPINDDISLVNAYIWELCARYDGVEVFDINRIGRNDFTKHGMHLTRRGKKRLAGLLLSEIQSLGRIQGPPPAPRQAETPCHCLTAIHDRSPANCDNIFNQESCRELRNGSSQDKLNGELQRLGSETSVAEPITAPAGQRRPRKLAHDTYAAAVRAGSPPASHTATCSPKNILTLDIAHVR